MIQWHSTLRSSKMSTHVFLLDTIRVLLIWHWFKFLDCIFIIERYSLALSFSLAFQYSMPQQWWHLLGTQRFWKKKKELSLVLHNSDSIVEEIKEHTIIKDCNSLWRDAFKFQKLFFGHYKMWVLLSAIIYMACPPPHSSMHERSLTPPPQHIVGLFFAAVNKV